jgi:hypothetical protein
MSLIKTLNKRGPRIDLGALLYGCQPSYSVLKGAQVTPIHKKNDPLNKSNYRPVSVLPIFSK